MEINVESPWTAKEEEFVAGMLKPLFIVTGIDRRTGRVESYKNASFSWVGIKDDKPMWSIAGECASYALESIDNIEKMKTAADIKIEMRLPEGKVVVDDNVALISKIAQNRGESISLSWKLPSGIDKTLYVDVLDTGDDNKLKVIDSYTEREISLKSIAKLLVADKYKKITNDFEPC